RNILNSVFKQYFRINLNYIPDFWLDSNMPEFNFITKNNFVFNFINNFILYNFKKSIKNKDSFRYIINKAITFDYNPLSLKKHSFISILDIIFTNDQRSEIIFNGLVILFDTFSFLNYKPIVIFKFDNVSSNLNCTIDLNSLKLPKKSLEIMQILIEKNNFYISHKYDIVFSDNEFYHKKDSYYNYNNGEEFERKNDINANFKDPTVDLIYSYFYNIDFDVILFKDAGFTINQENNITYIYQKNDFDNFYYIKDKLIETIELLNKFENFIIIIFRSSIYVFIDDVSINDLTVIIRDFKENILPSNTIKKYILAIDIVFNSNEKIYQKLESKLKFLYEKINSQKLNADFLVSIINSFKKNIKI
ncbi:MAG: hypothetical protein QXY79_04585, partial [Candidatus Methanomethylicia archaeon]